MMNNSRSNLSWRFEVTDILAIAGIVIACVVLLIGG